LRKRCQANQTKPNDKNRCETTNGCDNRAPYLRLKTLASVHDSSALGFSLSAFLYGSETYFADSLNHFLNLCLSFVEINHRLFLTKTHVSPFHALEPFQGSFHGDGSSTSGHSIDLQRRCFDAADSPAATKPWGAIDPPIATSNTPTMIMSCVFMRSFPRFTWRFGEMFDVSSGKMSKITAPATTIVEKNSRTKFTFPLRDRTAETGAATLFSKMKMVSEGDSDHANRQKDRPILHRHHHEDIVTIMKTSSPS
jgi:hypothetical protein